eukprot:817162-Pleurochrysis_carterae.AAC.3
MSVRDLDRRAACGGCLHTCTRSKNSYSTFTETSSLQRIAKHANYKRRNGIGCGIQQSFHAQIFNSYLFSSRAITCNFYQCIAAIHEAAFAFGFSPFAHSQ